MLPSSLETISNCASRAPKYCDLSVASVHVLVDHSVFDIVNDDVLINVSRLLCHLMENLMLVWEELHQHKIK